MHIIIPRLGKYSTSITDSLQFHYKCRLVSCVLYSMHVTTDIGTELYCLRPNDSLKCRQAYIDRHTYRGELKKYLFSSLYFD